MDNLINETLSKISKEYHSGLIEYLQRNFVYWPKVIKIEARINLAVLEGDQNGLLKGLDDYKDLFEEVMRLFLRSENAVAVPVRDISQIKKREEVKEMKVREMFPPKYLNKDDICEPQILTIRECRMENIEFEENIETKPILYFEEYEDRGLVLNKTNAMTLEELYGDSDEWPGHKIEVYVDSSIRFGSKKLGGVRFRVPSKPSYQEELQT